jgi:protein-tyrosine-phosphatase
MENRHLEQELAEIERLKLEKADSAAKNATALKHVHRRISLLGNEATEEHLRRFEEEANAMDELERRHKREMDALLRFQRRERLNLQREQTKELLDFRKKMKEEFDEASRTKRSELEQNMRKLDDTIRDRKSRLTAKWYLELQIFKQETAELRDSFIGPLPLRILGLPAEFLDGGSY